MVKIYALVILLLVILIYQHTCSHSPAIFASFPLCANLHINSTLPKPKWPLRPDSWVQGCKSKHLIWHPNVCLSFAADTWPIDRKYFILSELKQGIETDKTFVICSIANRPLQFGTQTNNYIFGFHFKDYFINNETIRAVSEQWSNYLGRIVIKLTVLVTLYKAVVFIVTFAIWEGQLW